MATARWHFSRRVKCRPPKKKMSTLNEVGNRFKTKVPNTPRAKCIRPVHTDAMISAIDPSSDCCILTTVRKDEESKDWDENPVVK